jgi:FkbM family methyltransferase
LTGVRALGTLARAARRAGLGGALRALRDGLDRLLFALRRPPLRVSVDGIDVRGFLRHRSFLDHLARGDYETYLRRLFVDALAGSNLVLDVGAHVGFYSLLAARGCPGARVVAIEADPYNAAALAANVRRADSAIEVVAKAAADEVGRAVFQQNLGTVGSSLVVRRGTGPTRVVEVETTTVDALVAANPVGRLLLKLDVEGAERRALAGMHATIGAAESVVALVEVNPKALAESRSTAADLVADLEALGLEVLYVDEETHTLTPVPPETPKGNLLARR